MHRRGGNTKAVTVISETREEVLRLPEDNVEQDSTIYSDEARAYDSVGSGGRRHERVNHSARKSVNGTTDQHQRG